MSFQHDHLMGSRPATVGEPIKVNRRAVSLQHHHLTGSRWTSVEEPIKGSSTDDTIPCRFSTILLRDHDRQMWGTRKEYRHAAPCCVRSRNVITTGKSGETIKGTATPCRFVSKISPVGNTTGKWGNPSRDPPCRVVHIRSHYGITTTNRVGEPTRGTARSRRFNTIT